MPYIKSAIIILIATLISSCSLPIDLWLKNSTNELILIQTENDKFSITPGNHALIKEIEYAKISITINDKKYKYDFFNASFDYNLTKIEGFIKKSQILYAEIDSNGIIWAIDKKSGKRHEFKINPNS